jgi:predicted lipoprotein with Yx(FWY)xxD motif
MNAPTRNRSADQTMHGAKRTMSIVVYRRTQVLVAAAVAALWLSACGSAAGPMRTSASSAARPAQTATALRTAVAPPRDRPRGQAITTRTGRYGRILTDGGGRTIYLFTHDRSSASTCYGRCAAAWPPVLTRGAPRALGGLSRSAGTTRRRDGRVQVTFGGHPLYYYVGDVRPGEILCQNVDEFGGTWLVVSRDGAPVR